MRKLVWQNNFVNLLSFQPGNFCHLFTLLALLFSPPPKICLDFRQPGHNDVLSYFNFHVAGASCSLLYFLTFLLPSQPSTCTWDHLVMSDILSQYPQSTFILLYQCTLKWHWHNTLLWNLFIRSFGGFPLWLNVIFYVTFQFYTLLILDLAFICSHCAGAGKNQWWSISTSTRWEKFLSRFLNIVKLELKSLQSIQDIKSEE